MKQRAYELPIEYDKWLTEESANTARTRTAIVLIGLELLKRRPEEVAPTPPANGVTRMVQFRINEEEHAFLKQQAHARQTSMGKVITLGLQLYRKKSWKSKSVPQLS